jgi:hypothetical protein
MTLCLRAALPSLVAAVALVGSAQAADWGDPPVPDAWDGTPTVVASASPASTPGKPRQIPHASPLASAPVPQSTPFAPQGVVVADGLGFAGCTGCAGTYGREFFGDCCGPLWTARADGILLHRSNPDDAVLVTDSFLPGGNTLLDAANFDFDFEGGFDVSLRRHNIFGTCWDLEALYFGVDGWNAQTGAINSASGAAVQFAHPIGNIAYGADLSASYRSELHNVEINGWRPIRPWLSLLAGFRYMELNENGLALTQDVLSQVPNTANYAIGAENRLTGFQIGADTRVWSGPRLDLNCTLKAGVFDNRASNGVSITQDLGGNFASDASASHTAFVGQLDVAGVYRLNSCWSLRAGYQLLWIEGVALASEQVAVSDPFNGLATVDTTGSPFYHGAFFGLEFRR